MSNIDDDIIRNASIAGIAAIPVLGGPIAFLLDKYLPSEIERKRNLFLTQLSRDIEILKSRIDVKNLDTPEFRSICMTLLRHAIEEYREEKITAFNNLILNVAIDPSSFNKVDLFSRLVIYMIPDQIALLKFAYALDVDPEFQKLDTNPDKRNWNQIVCDYWGIQDSEYIASITADCMRYFLLSASNHFKEERRRPGTYITPLGIELLQYIGDIAGEENGKSPE